MITTKIKEQFPEHKINEFNHSIYIADYTNQTKNDPIKRSVEIHTSQPSDIDFFSLINVPVLDVSTVIYDKYSFVNECGESQTQCECVAFPSQADETSWIMFLELKYCKYQNAIKNLHKAKKQVDETYKYYKSRGIVKDKHLAYLLVSLPKQNNTPFESFITTPAELIELRRKNIIFKGVNEARIKDKHLLHI